MKRLCLFSISVLLMAACADDVDVNNQAGRYITFTASENIVSGTRGTFFKPQFDTGDNTTCVRLQSDDSQAPELYLETTDEDRITSFDTKSLPAGLTRAALFTGTSFAADAKFGVSEYTYNTTSGAIFTNETATITATTSKATVPQVWPSDAQTQAYDFYAYYPPMTTGTPTNGLTLTDGQTITYSLASTNPKDVPDLMTAKAGNRNYGDVPLTFDHALTAVVIQTKSGFNEGTIKQVKFKNISTSASLTIGGSWGSYGALTDYTVDTDNGASGSAADVYNGSTTLMMLPQAVGTNGASLEITIQDAADANVTHTVSTSLTGTWSAGHKITYTVTTAEITSITLTYPQWTLSDGSATTYGPVDNYTTSESVGLFVVDNNNKIVVANEQLAITSASGHTATCALPTGIRLLSQSYRYYVMYPYVSTATLAASPYSIATGSGSIFQVGSTTCKTSDGTSTVNLSTNPDADTFFANVTAGWAVETDQSSGQKIRQNDLQVGKVSGTSTKTFAMSHKMGLAVITLEVKNVPTEQYFNSGGAIMSGYTDGTTTSVTASNIFSGNLPYVSGISCYSILPISTNKSFIGTGADGWTESFTANAGSGKYCSFTAQSKRTFIYKTWTYGYKGSVETFTCPVAGSYKLKVWGAQGGSNTTNGTGTGGKGGYSYGNKTLSVGTQLYVCVGGAGVTIPGFNTNRAAGGYNGGGHGVNTTNDSRSTGGGCTHIAITTNRGELRNYSSNRTEVLIVAGGGGGGGCHVDSGGRDGGSGGGSNGGHAGGYATSTCDGFGGPSDGNYPTIGAGNVLQGGFGYGGNYYTSLESASNSTGGGGGYWGGNSGFSSARGGGGGCGYIGGVTDGVTSNGVRSGNGYAIITTNFEWAF